MSDKIIGFSIVIKGQKTILDSSNAFGLLGEEIKSANIALERFNDLTKTSGKEFSRNSKSTISSAEALNNIIGEIVSTYGKASDKVTDLGGDYKRLEDSLSASTKQIQEQAKAIQRLEKALQRSKKKKKEEQVTDAKRINQLQKLIKLTKEEEAELKRLLKQQQLQRAVAKQRVAIAKNEAILENEARGTRRALKAELALITIELNKYTKAQQLGTKAGRTLTSRQKELNETLFDLESKGGTFSRRVGDYARGLLSLGGAAKGTRKTIQQAQKSITRFALKLTVGRSVVEGLANGVRFAVDGLKDLITEAEGTNEVFNKIQGSTARFTATLKNTGRSILNNFGGTISTVIDNFAFAIDSVVNAFKEASEGTGFFSKILKGAIEAIKNFPAIFGGIGGVISELTGRFTRFGKEASLRINQLGASLRKAKEFVTGGDVEAINRELATIEEQLQNNVIASQSFSDAYKDGFDSTKKAQEEFKKRSQDLADQEAENEKKRKARQKAIAAAEKKLADDRRKAAAARKKLLKDQADALKKADAQQLARLEFLEQLADEIEDLQLQSLKEGTAKQIREEDLRFQRQEENRKKNFASVESEIQKEQARLVELFGEGSKEVIENQKSTDDQLRELREVNDELAEQQERQHQANLQKIREDSDIKRIELLKKQASDRLNFINALDSSIEEVRSSNEEESLDALRARENRRFELEDTQRKESFEKFKQELIKQQKELEKVLSDDPEKLKEEQDRINASLIEAQEKTNELAEAQEKRHQEKLNAIVDDSAKERSKNIREAVVSIFNEVASAFTAIQEQANEAEKERFSAAIEERKESISALNDDLNDATGLQKQFLERQIKEEEAALKKQEEQAIASEKARANEAKIVGLGIAAINGAVAITRAFSDLGPIAGAVAAVGVAATLAVQVAEITRQKFQDGGLLKGPSHANDGIPIAIKNGPIVEAEGGEFIMNKESTAANFDLIEKINASKGKLKFQNGGPLGTPSVAPSVANLRTDSTAVQKTLDAVTANSRAIQAVNQTVKNLKVNLVYPELEEENSKNAQIVQQTSL